MISWNVIVFLVFALVESSYQIQVGDRCVDNYTQTIGKCTPAESCDSARKAYHENGVRPTLCLYSPFGTTLVCCKDGIPAFNVVSQFNNVPRPQEDSPRPQDDSPRPQYDSPRPQDDSPRPQDVSPNPPVITPSVENRFSTIPTDTRRVSEKKCDEYSKAVVEKVEFLPLLPNPERLSITSAKCDYIGVKLIVGGEKASQGEFPHMAAIGWTNFEGSYDFKCGGALISNKFVVTAGHCIRDPSARYPEPAVVRLGDQNIDDSVADGADPITVPIKQITKHPNYKPPGKYNDIALLLITEVTFTSNIRPACLWNRPDFAPHKSAIATGWGVIDPDTRQTSNELQKVSLTLFENDDCDNLLANIRNRLWRGFMYTQMCAGELRGGKDTCQGDSGSPLQVPSKENQCIFNIVGLTSFGAKCAKTGQPAVYTRVYSYLDWIESVVWPGE
ncbi:serine protease snake-like isoform X1 [Ostrinia nubilalis]|uniref:serine protease snake-like isoform X1 n=1 Tax=Ostrinia nubilalis TaxID=29057 RepID=UPI003082469A